MRYGLWSGADRSLETGGSMRSSPNLLPFLLITNHYKNTILSTECYNAPEQPA